MSDVKKDQGLFGLIALSGTKKSLLAGAAVFATIAAFCGLAPQILIYRIMVALTLPGFASGQTRAIEILALAAAGFTLVRYLLMFIAAIFSHMAAFQILYGLRKALTRHLGTLPMGYFTANRTGKLKKILYEDVEQIETFIAHHIPDMVAGIVVPLTVVGFLFFVNVPMAVVALLPLPLAFFTQQKAFKNKGREQYHDALETMNAAIIEYVRGMPVVKIFNQSARSFAWLTSAVTAYQTFIRRLALEAGPSWAAFITITASGLAFILPFGLWFYWAGWITLPVFFLFLMLGSSYMAPLFRLAAIGGQMGQISEGMKRINAVLFATSLKTPAASLPPVDLPGRSAQVSLAFNHVNFAFGQKQVIHNLTFTLKPGTVTALVGPSGAGKSTIAGLIMRYWQPLSGSILLNGMPAHDIPVERLMDRIGFVAQELFIFNDTVYENIRMGNPKAGMKQVEKAAKAAQCLDFIRNLPQGFDTPIGEGGQVQLSGGEKQRITLARIMIKNAPLIVLDEATAFADARNEALIQQAFSRIMHKKTVLVIAHRLSSVKDADNILVIDRGRIVQQGRHPELIARDGIYKALWQAHDSARNWTLKGGGHA